MGVLLVRINISGLNLALPERVQNSELRTSLRVPRRTRIAEPHKLARSDQSTVNGPNLALLERVTQNSALRPSLWVPRRTRIAEQRKLARLVQTPGRFHSLQSHVFTRFGATNPLLESLRTLQGLLGKSLASDQARKPS